tara:strand:+ start:113 stop:358 length:246 start_codon:yes stop_codon:yes gene_type:complete
MIKQIKYDKLEDCPILEWQTFCGELEKLWNTTKSAIPELDVEKDEQKNVAAEIFQQLIYDYALYRNHPDRLKVLNFQLAEA